jgi:hypothetical protein
MSFSGTVESDFMKLGDIPENRKADLINFAATDFETIKKSLVDYINAVYPKDFNNFYASELGVMLIDLVSYMGAVTSFKADALANECFIRTVKNRVNLRSLLQLIGVSLRGPGSASAKGRLTWDGESNPTGPQVSAINISSQSRSVTVASPEDESPVNYTLYKLDSNNAIENIQNADDSLVFYGGTDSDNGMGAGGLSSVYTGMALVEGAYVVDAGTFDSTETAKSILLTNGPVIENSVRVFVEAVDSEPSDATGAYLQVDKLFSASGSTDRVFEVVYDGDYNGIVVFGDGSLSISPPQNANYTVSYRIGGGTRGNLEKGSLNLIINSTDGIGNSHSWRLENTTVMAGGADAETALQAKKFAPYTFKSQDRLVTLTDYIAFGNRFYSSTGSTGKVTAVTREGYSSANIIDLFVLEKATGIQLQKAAPTFKKDLLSSINDKKMLTDHVVVNDGVVRTLDLTVSLRVDKEYKEIEETIKRQVSFQILSFFAVDNMDFGKDFLKVELERKVFQLSQIRFATIDNIPDVVAVDHNEIIQLNNFSLDIVYL